MTRVHAGLVGVAALMALFGGGFVDLLALGVVGATAYSVGSRDKSKVR